MKGYIWNDTAWDYKALWGQGDKAVLVLCENAAWSSRKRMRPTSESNMVMSPWAP